MSLPRRATLEEEGQYNEALQVYQEVLSQDPGNPDALSEAGWLEFEAGVLGRSQQSLEQGESNEESAVTVDPGLPDRARISGLDVLRRRRIGTGRHPVQPVPRRQPDVRGDGPVPPRHPKGVLEDQDPDSLHCRAKARRPISDKPATHRAAIRNTGPISRPQGRKLRRRRAQVRSALNSETAARRRDRKLRHRRRWTTNRPTTGASDRRRHPSPRAPVTERATPRRTKNPSARRCRHGRARAERARPRRLLSPSATM